MKVGIIGLGLMGLGFSKSLLGKGYEVYGYDLNSERGKMLEDMGGHACENAAQVGRAADAVILMVFNADNVRSVLYDGENALLPAMSEGKALLITCSVGTDVVCEITEDIRGRGVRLLDTPLMGDCFDAESGSIHIIVAGAREDYLFAETLLKAMGSEIYFVGDNPGDGQKAKSCLQALFSLTFETGFEVYSLARRVGLNMEEMDRLFRNSPSSSSLLHITEKNVLEHIYTGTKNPLAILNKDIRLAVDLGEKYGVNLSACKGTASIFALAMEKYEKEDVWAAAKIVDPQEERFHE